MFHYRWHGSDFLNNSMYIILLDSKQNLISCILREPIQFIIMIWRFSYFKVKARMKNCSKEKLTFIFPMLSQFTKKLSRKIQVWLKFRVKRCEKISSEWHKERIFPIFIWRKAKYCGLIICTIMQFNLLSKQSRNVLCWTITGIIT